MAVKTVSELKTQIDGVIKVGDANSITPPLDNSIRTNVIDSFLNLKDGGLVLQSQVGYSTAITPSADYSFATKKYVDDEISGISVTPVWGSITGTVTDQTDLMTYLSTNYQPAGSYQPLDTNLTSLSGLSYVSTSFVKMTAAGTFALDTNTYALNSDLGAYLKLDLSNSPLTGSTLTTTQTTFNLLNTTVTTLNLGGAATTLTLGGTPTTAVTHNYSTNATATANTKTINFATGGASGSATNINIGSSTGTTSNINGLINLANNETHSGTIKITTTSSVSTPGYRVTNNASVIGGLVSYSSGVPTIGNSVGVFSSHSLRLFTDSNVTSGGTNSIFFYAGGTDATQIRATISTGQNSLSLLNGVKIGNNTDSAGTAGAGSVRYNSGLNFSDGANWLTIATAADLLGYSKIDGSNTPFTGAIRIEPISGTALTLKGSGATSATKALSVTDSSNVEYFYLRNDGQLYLNGKSATSNIISKAFDTSSSSQQLRLLDSSSNPVLTVQGNGIFSVNNLDIQFNGVYHKFTRFYNEFNDSGVSNSSVQGERLKVVGGSTSASGTNYVFSVYNTAYNTNNNTTDISTTYSKQYIWNGNTYLGNVRNTLLDNATGESGGNITNYIGLGVKLSHTVGTITNHYYLKSELGTGSATITNNYVLHNADAVLKGTNKWFLYNDDNTVNSYLKGQLQLVGTNQNALVVTNGIKIGNNTDSAATAGAGSIKYVSSTLQYSDGSNWNTVGNATILTASTTILEASWSGNTDYEYTVAVTGAVQGDFCMVMPNDTVMGAINTASADWKGYAYCSSANTVTVVCRVSSFISVSGTFTVKVIK